MPSAVFAVPAPIVTLQVDAAGAVLKGAGGASAETAVHLALVETCGAGAVLHTHSQAGSLLSQYISERVLSYVAGTGFILIGLFTLYRAQA